MRKINKIQTVGLCPSWDMVCALDGVDWGDHKTIGSSTNQPAGKALNISRALAYMRTKSTAVGLWGRQDYDRMLGALVSVRQLIKVNFTIVPGATRQNVTVVDTANSREMHLRNNSALAGKTALRKLKSDLGKIVNANSICVFAGAMPEKRFLNDVIGLIDFCRAKRAKLAIDTYGAYLKRIVRLGGVWMISPNAEELSELLQKPVKDEPATLAKAAAKLLGKVEVVLISRGKKGCVAVTKDGSWQARFVGTGKKVLSTVGCGDYLLAGFLKGLKDKQDIGSALETAIKIATAKAWGWTETKTWSQVERQVKVKVVRMQFE